MNVFCVRPPFSFWSTGNVSDADKAFDTPPAEAESAKERVPVAIEHMDQQPPTVAAGNQRARHER